jgi:hypothetical protein
MGAEIPEWKSIKLENISIRNGKVEIGFAANGAANTFCYVDDVVLVRTK